MHGTVLFVAFPLQMHAYTVCLEFLEREACQLQQGDRSSCKLLSHACACAVMYGQVIRYTEESSRQSVELSPV